MRADLLALLALLVTLGVAAGRPDLNAGILALAAAFLVGVFAAGMDAQAFGGLLPGGLLLTLVSVMLFFELLRHNGTLEVLTHHAVRLLGGSVRGLPWVFFLLAFLLSALGPGNIAATALLAPMAMRGAVQAGLSPLLMAVMVCTGANAGTFSPVAVTGNINLHLMQQIGLTDPQLAWEVFGQVAVLQGLSALLAFLLFRSRTGANQLEFPAPVPLNLQQRVSVGCLVLLLELVVLLGWSITQSALLLVCVLGITRMASTEQALQALPWSVVVLIGGVSVLLGVLEETGGLKVLTTLLADLSGPGSVHGLLALLSGLASVGSSSSGVVLPLFVPLTVGLAEASGASVSSLVVAVDVGSHMVDVSPLSTLGALCLAALPEDRRVVTFRPLLFWGLAMAVFGAVVCWLVLGL